MVSRKSGGNTNDVAVDTSPMAQLHRSFSNRELYREQDTRSTSEITTLTHELISAGSADLAAFATDTKDLIEHFVHVSRDSLVKQKAFGALFGILKVTLCLISHNCYRTY